MGFDRLVGELGGDATAVQKAAGVQLTQVVDPDTLISARLATTVLNLSAQETHCDHFGLELAKQRILDDYFGVLGDILRTSPTLRHAFTEVFGLFTIHSEVTFWQLQTSGEVAYILFSPLEEQGQTYKQVQQLVIALLWRFVNVLTGYRWRPATVSFTFARPHNELPYRRFFGTYVDFDADFCGVTFHASDLNIAMPDPDRRLLDRLRRQAQDIRDTRARSFDEDVRILIRKNLELRQVGEENITRFYPFERRTFQRKLHELGTGYGELLKEVRTAMAMELLSGSDTSITRISERLCYKDLPNFSKAFKQQTGQTPREWRKEAKTTFTER